MNDTERTSERGRERERERKKVARRVRVLCGALLCVFMCVVHSSLLPHLSPPPRARAQSPSHSCDESSPLSHRGSMQGRGVCEGATNTRSTLPRPCLTLHTRATGCHCAASLTPRCARICAVFGHSPAAALEHTRGEHRMHPSTRHRSARRTGGFSR